MKKGFSKVEGLYAFWRYDSFPYVLGGPVSTMNERGDVTIPTYGNGVVTPIKIVPYDAGRKLLEQIDALRAEHREVLDKLNDDFTARVLALIPEAKR